MAALLSQEFWAGVRAGKRWLREIKQIEDLFKAAIEANEAVQQAERVIQEKQAAVAALEDQHGKLAGQLEQATADTNARLAEIAAHATAEKQKFDQQVADARVRADKARQQADLIVQECAAREAEALKAVAEADQRRAEAEKIADDAMARFAALRG